MAPSTRAPVAFFETSAAMSPTTDHVTETVAGNVPVTVAFPVAGEMPATWKYDVERGLVPEETTDSIAPTVRYFES